MPPYFMPEWDIVFITRDWRIINKIKLGRNMINVAAACMPRPATAFPASCPTIAFAFPDA